MDQVVDLNKDFDKSKLFNKMKALRREACKVRHSASNSRGVNHSRIMFIRREIARMLTRIRSMKV